MRVDHNVFIGLSGVDSMGRGSNSSLDRCGSVFARVSSLGSPITAAAAGVVFPATRLVEDKKYIIASSTDQIFKFNVT